MPNSQPLLSGFSSSLTIDEDAANLSPQLIDTDVTFIDADNNFDGGTLLLSGLLADDIVGIRNQGTGAGQIGFSGGTITFGGTIIGTASGGSGTALSVTFSASATSAAIEALIENLTFSTLSDTPVATRTLELTITDAAGARATAGVTLAARTGAANPFDGIDVGFFAAPDLVDLDGDGDLDLMIGEYEGTIKYFENTGSSLAPAYIERTGAASPFNGIDIGFQSTPRFGDLDGDGDLDLVTGENLGALKYFENTGSVVAPAYTERTGGANPFGGMGVSDYSAPTFADLDGDGDLDLAIGAGDGTLEYHENTGSSVAPAYTLRTGAANPFDGIDVGSTSAPVFADFDGDGDLDLVIGETNGNLNYYENTGTGVAPVYSARTGAANPFEGIGVGIFSAPAIADLDGDGDFDLIVAESYGTLVYYENTTARLTPAFTERTGAANPMDGIDIAANNAPILVDIDGDGDSDLVIGSSLGTLAYYENTGTALAPTYTARIGFFSPFDGIDIGGTSTPGFADLDGDGDLDLVIGDSVGTFTYYENNGSAVDPSYILRIGTDDPFRFLDVGTYSTPVFADLDGDGDSDMVVGKEAGTLSYFQNTGTRLAPVFTERSGAANPFDGIGVGTYSSPSFADIDGDGDLDLVIGEFSGTLRYFENTGTALTPAYTERTDAANPFNGIDVGFYSSPSFADLDGDGDFDLAIGASDGTLKYLENTGSGFRFALNVTPHEDPSENADVMNGTAGNDTIDGLGGSDTIRGLGGSDFLVGGAGDDQVFGGDGADILFHGEGADLFDGGADIDYVTYAAAANVVAVNLADQNLNAYSAQGDSYVDVEAFYLTGASDSFIGDASNNFVFGQGGDDFILGGGGGDIIFGGGGNDFILSGALGDILSGGAGADTFAYALNQIEQDQILDFTVGEDKLAFDDVGFNVVNQQPFAGINFISTTSAVGASYGAGQSVFIYYSDLGLFYADTDGAGGSAPNLVAALAWNPALTVNDLVFT